jgi:glycosyltransferase involved in cell wall biosynthesis
MRVLLASPGMALGGAERVVAGLADGLVARGHDVAVSGAPGPLDDALPPGTGRIVLPERGRSPLGALEWALRLAPRLRVWRPDVIHGHNAKATAAAALAARLARGPRRPPVLGTHHGAATAGEARAARLLSRAADVVVCVSEDLVGAFPGPVRVIHNGVPPAPPFDAAALDAELGLAGAPLVAAVGRLVPEKGPERFLRAAALVHAAEPAARFAVVGDGPLRGELEALAGALGLDGAVRFTGARADARALIGRADVLVVASDSEGQSLVVLEALAAGTPVVSTPVSGMAGLLGAGAGVVAGEFSPEALADAVTGLLRAPARRARMGAAGAALARERLSLHAMVDAYIALYGAMSRRAPTMR